MGSSEAGWAPVKQLCRKDLEDVGKVPRGCANEEYSRIRNWWEGPGARGQCGWNRLAKGKAVGPHGRPGAMAPHTRLRLAVTIRTSCCGNLVTSLKLLPTGNALGSLKVKAAFPESPDKIKTLGFIL